MVTSIKLPDKKVVKMTEQKNNGVVPQRTLLGEVNEHITCPLCHGYYIDATTIVECLHSFCRSCIIKHLQAKSYCPVCEMMINSAKPNIKLDKALQDIVYKLVPGLFQKEMDRRQQFYASRPGPAASATPEQRGEDTERIIFSPEDVISFSLEYADVTDTDSISSKSSDSNEAQNMAAATRRYLQCPAVVNISHLKKFLSNKFDIDSSQFAIDILYKRVPLPDYYTLMDIAYIYNWKRNEPMRFFYQIKDYIAIRNRLFDINRKESHFGDRKPSPASTEDTNISSPALNLNANEHASDGSSGTNSPMPDVNNLKTVSDTSMKNNDNVVLQYKDLTNEDNACSTHIQGNSVKNSCVSPKKTDDDEEKSQFLNSFELTAKNTYLKTSPVKSNNTEISGTDESNLSKKMSSSPKNEETLKRKYHIPPNVPEMKKLKIEIEKTKLTNSNMNEYSSHVSSLTSGNMTGKTQEMSLKVKPDSSSKTAPSSANISTPLVGDKEDKKDVRQGSLNKLQLVENANVKRTIIGLSNAPLSTPKRKAPNDTQLHMLPPVPLPKTVSPHKIHVSRAELQQPVSKTMDVPIPSTHKKMPDLKPSPNSVQTLQNKQPINKVRMDLLANNSDIDRSKIISQLKSPCLGPPISTQPSGDSLRSLFDSCKINIPSSLSITLTDQKLDARNPNEPVNVEQKKNVVNKNLSGAGNAFAHKVPSPPVHNYIEILKLPDTDSKKINKLETNSEIKLNPVSKVEANTTQSKPINKSSETSAKGPIPNLKPISDTKIGKQSSNFSGPITFQQTFEQQLQSLQTDKKSKLPKNKSQVPKLVPATPKTFSAVGKPTNLNKPNNSGIPETKTSSALDLSTTHNVQTQLGPQQTLDKAFERMQSIANLAKKQNLPSKGWPLTMSQGNIFPGLSSRPLSAAVSTLRVPTTSNVNQIKPDKSMPSASHSNNIGQESTNKNNLTKSTTSASSTVSSPNYSVTSHSSPTTQPSPRQNRSPSSSPKLVIAEEKHNSSSEQNITQSNQILNLQLPNMSLPKNDSSKILLGPSKSGLKPFKSVTPGSKVSTIRQPIPQAKSMLNTSSDYHALMRQYEMLKAQRQYDIIYKNSLSQNEYNPKDKQMSAVQASIPFKLRKRVNLGIKKSNVENLDILNTEVIEVNKLKRSLLDNNLKNNSPEDYCIPTKVPRRKRTSKCNYNVEDTESSESNVVEHQKPLTSREKEIQWLDNFLNEHLQSEKSASLYVSGQPGTGKTASLSYTLHLDKFKSGYTQVYINCTMMKSAASIYSRICNELQIRTSGSTEKACLNAIEKYLQKKHKMILLVLDEIDQLDSKRQSVLYTIFEWPAMFTSHIVLIGIANALDLTERTLPRLQARCSLRPNTLHFAPYTKEQIINIFTTVLAREDKSNAFSPVALQMLAAKIAAVSGDMRRALDIGRRVIELARRNKFSENQSVDDMMKDATVTVELKQVLEVLNDVYGGSRNIEHDVDDGIPMQQKLILCSLMLILTKGKNKDVVMGKLHDIYKRVALARNIVPLDMSEMAGACSLLEARGAVRLTAGGGAGGRGRRLRLHWDEAELAAALRDKPLLSAILNDVTCLNNTT
ncbi:polycomb group protein Psc-like [Achroia grisella]|uniref:polycomb group protein Psc-like n=1 Tax=Achroia grisella TaxID=688607 RepID=UPI0027D34ED5|nr:polycomb group protein Psc-like [Achroia grisella]